MVSLAQSAERGRTVAGLALYITLMLIGGALLFFLFLLPPLGTNDPEAAYQAMGIGALLAFPPLLVYLWVPWVVDRYDPEPWWTLAMALAWGLVAACGFSALVNSGIEDVVAALAGGGKDGAQIGDVVGACVSAPLTEEFWKGLAVFGMFYFLRREFDGVVDGIIYATFAALGFAATENVIYYARAFKESGDALGSTFFIRGMLAPWGHPLYTSMTGIGFGIARETEKPAVRWLAPIGGYFAAAFLHFVWNASATFGLTGLMLPLWFLFVLAFFVMILVLVVRKGRIIRERLRDEVLVGNLSPAELELVTSPMGRVRATASFGALGRQLVRVCARLGLSKWHVERAMRGKKGTVSMDFIVPLRQELAQIRAQIAARYPRSQAMFAPQQPAYLRQQPHAPLPQSNTPQQPPQGYARAQPGYGPQPPPQQGYRPPPSPGYRPPQGPPGGWPPKR